MYTAVYDPVRYIPLPLTPYPPREKTGAVKL